MTINFRNNATDFDARVLCSINLMSVDEFRS